ncbi:2-hydroxyacid dehydrogenase [Variovorax rhizosphaerae]|uniref:NAD(P)-dependent oxidoreductase n=1 Tax=Variovorax rhizosphaerae TaxID=1836200 RepID=A0ABU8WY24_9BURK
MSEFRVGITPDVLGSNGEPIFGREVLGLLDADGIAWEYMAKEEGGVVTPAQAARYDAICAMLTRVTAASLAGPDRRLKLIARFGVGYDTIDVPACTAAGVMLTIAPDGVRRPVATSALTFVLMLAQKVLIKDRLTRTGRWSEKLDHIGTGLTGRTLGSIGLGNIGAELFRLARPLEMNGIAHDPFADPALAAELGVRLVDMDTLFRESDFLCVNCPLSEATRGLVSARLLGLMKPSAYLINTARGPIVDERALHDAISSGRLAGAGLDVFEEEPTPVSNPLLQFDNVIVTPHGICFTDECMRRLAESAFRAVLDVAAGRTPPYVVNPP